MTTSQGRRHSTNCVRRVVAFLTKWGSWQTHHKMYISDCQLERELRSSGICWTSLSLSKTTKTSTDHIIKRTFLFANTLGSGGKIGQQQKRPCNVVVRNVKHVSSLARWWCFN